MLVSRDLSLQMTLQAYIDGLPIFTLSVYGWSSGQCGILIGILGLVAPVINTAVGAFSARLPDRHITVRPMKLLVLFIWLLSWRSPDESYCPLFVATSSEQQRSKTETLFDQASS